MVKVYVAGPLTKWGEHAAVAACVQLNVDKALALGAEMVEKGYNPYVPHCSHYLNEFANLPVDYETWLKLDFEWLEQCDVLFRMPGHSPGADREVTRAEKLNIPVVTTLEALDAFRDFWDHMPKGINNAELRRLWETEYKRRAADACKGAPRGRVPVADTEPASPHTTVCAPSVKEQREAWLAKRDAAAETVAFDALTGPCVSPEPCISDSEPFMTEYPKYGELRDLYDRIAVAYDEAEARHLRGCTLRLHLDGHVEIEPSR